MMVGQKQTRRRNSILSALTKIDRDFPGITRTQIIAFLYIAENPGINIVELAKICGFNLPTASRAARALGPAGVEGSLPPYLGLVDVCVNPVDVRGRILVLSPAGAAYCAQLDQIIQSGNLIGAAPPGESPEAQASRL